MAYSPAGEGREGMRLGRRALVAALGMALAGALAFAGDAPAAEPAGPGAVRVTSASDLNCTLRSGFKGRVIVPALKSWSRMVGDDDCNPSTPNDRPLTYIPIQANVQLVGERGPEGHRPQLVVDYRAESYPLFRIEQNDVRIEDLHLRGPWSPRDRTTDNPPRVVAIQIIANPVTEQGRRITIADNEIQGFSNSVMVEGAFVHDEPRDYDADPACEPTPLPCPHLEPVQANLIRVEGNYLHNSAMKGSGYGVVVGGGGYVTAEGNVFEYNNHSMAASGAAYSGYVARFNYVMRSLLTNHSGNWPHYFDVHGTGGGSAGTGGRGGTRFDIVQNTFRGELDYAFKIRGTPAIGAYFQDNVLAHDSRGDAFSRDGGATRIFISGNRWDQDYSSELATGDFDADRRTDAFVATGTGWFFSRGAKLPWEFLRASTRRTGDLGFADVDNDRATDVVLRDGAGRLSYLRRASGDPVALPAPPVPVPMKDLRFGDFDGDGRTDFFYTLNDQWRVWSGATGQVRDAQSSGKKVSEMLFGEFDDRRGTDVATVLGQGWSLSSGAATPWTRFNRRLTSSFAGAVAADVDGTTKSDIVFGGSDGWRYSLDGRGPLVTLKRGDGGVLQSRVGRFDGGPREGILSFGYPPHRDRLGRWMPLGGANGYVRHSASNMR